METAEAAPETETTPEDAEAEAPPPEQNEALRETPQRLFRFSRYIHVGVKADECPDRENGACGDPLHFHAWIRIPNQFQHDSIREKALAAKARKLRQFKDPESDAAAIMDTELDEMVAQNDREAFINEILQKDFIRDYSRAVADLTDADTDDEEGFAHIQTDVERYRALSTMPADERPDEEFKELSQQIERYNEALEGTLREVQAPVRATLEEKGTEDLRDMVRIDRIEMVGSEVFNSEYARWEWLVCTFKPKDMETKPGLPSERVWSDVNQLQNAAPEVIEALEQAFMELEAEAGQDLKGSS